MTLTRPGADKARFTHPFGRIEMVRAATPADLLAFGMSVSAHLARQYTRMEIVELYDVLWAASVRRAGALTKCRDCSTASPTIVDEIAGVAGGRGLLVGVAHVGPVFAAAALIAKAGIKVATVYWSIAERNRALLEASGVLLLALSGYRSQLQLCTDIRRLVDSGYTVFLIIETPMQSRSRFHYFGYEVRCSRLIELVSQRCDGNFAALYCALDDSSRIRLNLEPPGTIVPRTQELLTWVEEIILRQIEQYNWTESSIIFSDPCAYENALAFLPDILAWRERRLEGISPS